MASLNHVCMWSDSGWKRITADEAAKLHPGGTVSANSGLFMCELCGQYVTLTSGNNNTRHFRHSSQEKSKDCPDRTFGAGYGFPSYDPQEHDLPIRLVGVSPTSFRFELGLIRAPIDSLDNDFAIEIKPKGVSGLSFVYAKERLNSAGITYLTIGEEPFGSYTISFKNGVNELYKFWPKEVKGIDPEGSLFEKGSGKKLAYDADVEIEKEYYLLIRGNLRIKSCGSVQIREVSQKRFNWFTWNLYVVSASSFDESAARFFLDFHCRLTEHPVSLQAIWPLFVEGNYAIKYNQSKVYAMVLGNVAAVTAFPSATIRQIRGNVNEAKLYEVFCASRQQLVSVGRAHALEYTYFWREPLDETAPIPEVIVTDLDGSEITKCEISTIPRNRTLRFKSQYDGELIISQNNHIVDKQKIRADKYTEVSALSYGMSVKLVVGLDEIWHIEFKKQQSVVTNDETIILEYINVPGKSIPAPHALRNILVGMADYSQICTWIRRCIKKGYICEQAYHRLQDVYLNLSANNRGICNELY